MILSRLSCLLLLAGLVALSGCGKGPYETAPVSGRVTLDGQPVANAAVMFQPVAPEGTVNPGPGSYGITDAEGRYTLKLVGKETRGAVVGKHKVRVENYTDPGDSSDDGPRKRVKPAQPIPGKYNRGEAILEFEVPADGTDKADFPLTSGK
jgi:hypothetical protein